MDFNELVIKDYHNIFFNRFEDIMRLKRAYHGSFPLMDFGIGEEKDAPNPLILNALIDSLKESKNHKYSDNDYSSFLDSARAYVKRNFNVTANEKEIMHVMGAKSILAMIPSLFVEEGDYVVTLKPSYVVLERAAQLRKAKIEYLSLSEENQFYPDLDIIKEEVWKKTKILMLNFPHNPTGTTVDKKFYKHAIELAKKYHFLIINDAAYLGISYESPLAFMSIEGAKDVGIEIYTLSKSHNMTGFRIGFVIGNEKIISLLKDLKNNFDSGQYLPIQYAAKVALEHDEITNELKEKYLRRMKKIAMILFEHGLYAHIPYGTFYLYIKTPTFVKEQTITSAKEFAALLLNKVGIMCIPYDDVNHYVRLSMTYDCVDEEKFLKDFANRLDYLFF